MGRKAEEAIEVEKSLTRKMSEVQEKHVTWASSVKTVGIIVSVVLCSLNGLTYLLLLLKSR